MWNSKAHWILLPSRDLQRNKAGPRPRGVVPSARTFWCRNWNGTAQVRLWVVCVVWQCPPSLNHAGWNGQIYGKNWIDVALVYQSKRKVKLKGLARTQIPTNKNNDVAFPTFGEIAGVNHSLVQWSSLALEEPPSWSWLRPLVQVSMLHCSVFKMSRMWFS